VITDAPLDADPIIEEPICDGCMECVRKCPAKALSSNRTDDVEVTGVTHIHRCALDTGKCSVGHYGGLSPFTPDDVLEYSKNIVDGSDTHTADGKERPSDDEIVSHLRENVTYTKNAYDFTYGPAVVCGGCIRACLTHLDKVGRLTKKANHPL
jgi:ferredoxin